MSAVIATPARVRLAGQRQSSIATAHFRLMVVMLLFIGVTGIIASRLVWLSLFEPRPLRNAVPSGLIPERADIVDRNGVPLARTFDAWSIAVHPNKLVGKPEDIAPKLAALMPQRSEAQYLAILRSGKKFVYLDQRALPELVSQVNAIGEPALAFGREPERLYPQGTLASHVLGWIKEDGSAVSGMERTLDARLNDPARRGTPAALSIDARVQAALETELQAAMIKHQSTGGSGMVLDVDTGEILAMTSLPSFNPNAPGKGAIADLQNKATLNVYELGSTFKMLTVANAIENGVVTSMAQRWDATAPLVVGRYKIHDDHPQNRRLSVPEVLVFSSNIGTARIADALGAAKMQSFFRAMGFDAPAPIELGARGRPLWPHYWARTTVMTSGYGHGIAVTPLHLAVAYATLVNGGIWRPATLLKREGGAIPAGHRVISAATSYRMRQLMRMVVLKGTGRKADVPGYRLGGKTGTADLAVAGGYNHNARNSVFAATFPVDHPRYAVVVMLQDPKGTADTFGHAEAAWTVGPVVAHLVARAAPLLGVMPDASKEIDLSELMPLVWDPKGGNAAE